MALVSGSCLGPYEILSPLGAGGMGEVYRATDTVLKRQVALKVLPPDVASDPERVARFQREAEVLASLNHPNIAHLYGLERSGGTLALVMELVDGPTLADRIAKGAIPLDEALPIAKQIAEALEAAHDQGIIHRDLKPANVKVREDGTVKVLDFGLAKAMEAASGVRSGASEMTNSPTITSPALMTGVGVLLGTAAYMAPEQARGKTVDTRADIWAFGAVVYEMLTGRQAFVGETITDVLASVVKSDPDWKAVPPTALRLLKNCLVKDPKNRLHAIGDAWLLLGSDAALSAPSPSPQFGLTSRFVVGALVAIAALASLGWWRAMRPVERSLVRLDIDLGSDVAVGTPFGNDAIISPDGTRLVYVSQNRLLARLLDQPKAVELAGSDGAYAPFFSPDGEWVGFFTTGKLKKISIHGGAAIELCDARSGRGGSWGEDGTIIAALGFNGGLSRIPSAGGTPTTATELDHERKESTHRWPQVLNGGQAVLFTAHTSPAGFDEASIEVISFADGRRTTLQRGGMYGRYLPSGHLVYVSRGTLWAVPFDLRTLAVHGIPVPLAEQVAYSVAEGSALLDSSRIGTLMYRTGRAAGLVTVQWLDRSGRVQPLLPKPDFYQRPRLSPDGHRLALRLNELWIYEWARDTMTRVTSGGGGADNPLWTVDGRFIVFEQLNNIQWARADGGGPARTLIPGTNPQNPQSFTADGKRLAFHGFRPGTGFDIWTVAIENDGVGLKAGTPDVFLQSPFNEREPAFSPDGHWLAYVSDESGEYQVYVRAFPDRARKSKSRVRAAWYRCGPRVGTSCSSRRQEDNSWW